MKNLSSLLSASFLLLAACDAAEPSASAPDAVGGKADGFEDATDLRCVVVGVLDGEALEEGLGSIYDIDEDGYAEADEDSVVAGVRASEDAEAGLFFDLGQLTIGFGEGDRIERVDLGEGALGWQAVDAEEPETTWSIKIFEETGLGFAYLRHADGEPGAVAKLDCREGVSVPNIR